MEYVSLIMSEDAAHACVRELGQLGCIQFTDLNPELTPFQRRYVIYIKRCDEIERKIRYVHGEIKKMNLVVQPAGSVDQFVDNASGAESATGTYLLETLENKLENYEQQLLELNKYSAKLTEEYNSKVEFHHVLVKARTFFMAEVSQLESAEISGHSDAETANLKGGVAMIGKPLLPDERGQYQSDREMTFANIAGVLPASDRARFERMLFRATRGNCYVRFASIEDPLVDATGNEVQKVVFIIFYKSTAIEGKIKRICDAFSAHRFDVVNLDRPQDLEAQQVSNHRELQDAKVVLDKNTETRLRLCSELSQFVEEWLWVVRREKSIYHTLNLFKSDVSNLLRGQGWILKDSVEKAKSALLRAHSSLNLPSTSMLERVTDSHPTPPTHFRTNKYTDAFQEFVNTYGIPRYREANPALFTAATFPFLFGVMYGDIGHGGCLLIAGLFLILTEKNADSRGLGEMMKGIYSARYMLAGMGVCSVYCGLIYNDYFSLCFNLFGSRWHWDSHEEGAKAINRGEYGDSSKVYPFGVDPAWHVAANELLFFNSMKMKMSVILGIIQMTFGICLKGMNAHFFRSKLDFFGEFVPMIVFDMAFFGYMVILIFVKWSINWEKRMALGSCNYDADGVFGGCNLGVSGSCYSHAGTVCTLQTQLSELCPLKFGGTGGGCQPPNLITTLINIALQPGYVIEPMYDGQAKVQTFLLLIAFFMVPWLLLVKPLYLKFTHKPKPEKGATGADNPLLAGAEQDLHESQSHSSDAHGHDAHGGHGGEFNFGEIFIHQCIETIEFVLGMVSNTASYLRLWALSLAHTELATVFWEKAMLAMIVGGNPVGIYVGYAVFAAVTIGVLLCMDVLECFLHALRLHWVEFQNKFFKADGYRFQPFDFKAIISKAMLD